MRQALACLILLLLFSAATAAAEVPPVIRTVFISGLVHIDQAVLLADLGVEEGQFWRDDRLEQIKLRARNLSYLRGFQLRAVSRPDGIHLRILATEARRFRLGPRFAMLEDGGMAVGFHLSARRLAGREQLKLTLLSGDIMALSLGVTQLRLPGLPFLPFEMQTGLDDRHDLFIDSDLRRIWWKAGPSWKSRRGSHLKIQAGRELIRSAPPGGISPSGEDELLLLEASAAWQLPGERWRLLARGDLRRPKKGGNWAKAEGGLAAELGSERSLRLDAVGLAAVATATSPDLACYHLSSRAYFLGYEPGSLPSRQHYFTRLRLSRRVIGVPIRFSRREPVVNAPLSAFLVVESAWLRSDRRQPLSPATDAGLGLSLKLPGREKRQLALAMVLSGEGELRYVATLSEGDWR